MHFSLFFLIFTSILFVANLYIYLFFIKRLSISNSSKATLKKAMIVLFVIEIFYNLSFRYFELNFLSYSIGITFILFVSSITYHLITFLLKNILYFNRLKQNFDYIFLALVSLYIFIPIINGFQKPAIKEVDLKLKDFNVTNYKIVQLTDLHLGHSMDREELEDIVKIVNKLNPNIVVITGDLIDKKVKFVVNDLMLLKDLKAPTFFVTGNHEYLHNIKEIIKELKANGVRVLENESLVIDSAFNLAGIHDISSFRHNIYLTDINKSLSQIDNSLPTILLSHQPKISREIEANVSLILSGHTHGGQIFPFNYLVAVAQFYVSGLYFDKIRNR